MNAIQSVYQLAYELSPIILTNGIAQRIPGQMLPLVAITEAANFAGQLLGGNPSFNMNSFAGHFRPLPGSTLIENELGDYPFANQTVAANAIIAKPLKVSMLMNAPANTQGGYPAKIITFSALKATLDQHNQSGGTYTVLTPSYIYTNCILTHMVDVSRPDSQQPQNAWQFEFTKPLLTASEAQSVLNSLMSKMENQLPLQTNQATWSGVDATTLNTAGPTGATTPFISDTIGNPTLATSQIPSANWG